MVLSTAQSRSAWYPACRSKGATYLNAYRALDACLRRYGYDPGYGTGAFNCRAITGGSGYSLHAYGPGEEFRFWNGYRLPSTALAVDINPPQNPYGRRLVTDMPRAMVDAILRIRTNNGKQVWGWGGYFRRYKDSMHYEIVCSRNDLASGINAATLPGGSAPLPPPPAPIPKPKGFLMALTDREQDELLAKTRENNELIKLLAPPWEPERIDREGDLHPPKTPNTVVAHPRVRWEIESNRGIDVLRRKVDEIIRLVKGP